MPGNLELPPPEVIAAWPGDTKSCQPRAEGVDFPAFSGTLQAVTTLLVFTRLIPRAQRKARVVWASMMFTCVAILGAGQYGFDRHIYDIDFTKVTETALIAWLSQLAFLVSTSATKVSVLLTCVVWIARSVLGVGYHWCNRVLIGGCRPVNAYWRAYDSVYAASVEYTCTPTKFLNPLSGGLSVVSDFYAVVLPIGLLWHLNISKRQRYALNASSALALWRSLLESLGLSRHTWDLTWVGFEASVWAQLETQLAIICAGMPALRVFFRSFLRSNTVLDSNTYGTGSMSVRQSADGAKILSTFQVEPWSVRDGDAESLVLGKAE
ncbi:hypothetical protein TI39_contig353g00035 [Zymoseptoria brevis]|uniref:Rhodopsin domain-containing protein n=1 Tax=Zymoseptoria brevis TaxID=1047168 RepID=A0A0F4GRM2_9PEZI|nr:hypothetical protein TI39_contig353g00035 [Zymoseptoria brevis]